MKLATSLFCTTLIVGAACLPFRVTILKREIDFSLIPSLGFTAGLNPDGQGNCDGAVNDASGKPKLIPCSCPPDNATYIQALNANVDAGMAIHNPSVPITFPTGPSVEDQLGRIEAAIITMQNLNGPGVGCPIVSTTLGIQQKALQAGLSNPAAAAAAPPPPPPPPPPPSPAPPQAAPPPADPAPPPTPAVNSAPAPSPPADSSVSPDTPLASLTLDQLDQLVPPFGHDAGVNPTGTGDCDGAKIGANGQPIKVPCACPPPRPHFLQSLQADIVVGFAVNNPNVSVSFPLDGSLDSQRARIIASLIALQNLNGAGVGCPAASTTFSAQLAALG